MTQESAESAVAVSELTDAELNEAIAKAIDWKYTLRAYEPVTAIRQPDGSTRNVPCYATFIDSLSEVEARLREAGWRGPDLQWSAEPVTAIWWHPMTGPVGSTATVEARARAEVALSALQAAALNSPTTTAKGDA